MGSTQPLLHEEDLPASPLGVYDSMYYMLDRQKNMSRWN